MVDNKDFLLWILTDCIRKWKKNAEISLLANLDSNTAFCVNAGPGYR